MLSGYCKACVLKEDLRKVDGEEYKIWKNEHEDKCSVNYSGLLLIWKEQVLSEYLKDHKPQER